MATATRTTEVPEEPSSSAPETGERGEGQDVLVEPSQAPAVQCTSPDGGMESDSEEAETTGVRVEGPGPLEPLSELIILDDRRGTARNILEIPGAADAGGRIHQTGRTPGTSGRPCVILGMPWLKYQNRYINWEYRTVTFRDGFYNGPAEAVSIADVFGEAEADQLPPHHKTDCAIELDPEAKLPKPKTYPMTQKELAALQTEKEHEALLRQVLAKLRAVKLYAKLSKCEFHKSQLDYLGYRVSVQGIEMDPAKVQAVVNWRQPRTRKQLQSFLGFTNFYRQFIEGLAEIALPLTDLLKTKGQGETWVTQRTLKIKYCISFWGKNITCYWDLLPEMDSPSTYTLQVTEEAGRCQRDFGLTKNCVADQGERSCGIPVENLFAFYKIKLIAQNRRLRADSLEKCIHGMGIVKLSPPVLKVTAHQSHCLQLEWNLLGDELMSAAEAQYEIQYHDLVEMAWMQVNFTAVENVPVFANICGLFPFTNYSIQVRAKYLHSSASQSDGGPFWSDWSLEKFARTLPAVPSRGPAFWRKLGSPGADKKRVSVLMWKPLKPKEANGEILGYSLHSQRKGEPMRPECVTHDLQCTLLLPAREEFIFFLTAKNTVGISPPTKLVIPAFRNPEEPPPSRLPILASPAGDHSLLLQWSLPSTPKMDFILEWNKLPGKEGGNPHWQYQPENINHAVITEAIKPGNLYALKIFGLLDGRLGAFGSTQAYAKQIAPLRAPALYPTQVWKSWVELQWESLPLEERGGEIRNYTIYYKEERKDDYRTVVLDSSAHRCIINGLAPGSIVRVYLVAASEGGNTRGPMLSIRTKNYDYGEVEILLSVFCIGFIILLAGTLVCFSRHRSYVNKLRKYLWPQIPDPGKSNLATWMPQNMCLDFTSHCNEKWSHAYLGVTITDLKKVFPSQPVDPEPELFLGTQCLGESPKALQKAAPVITDGIVSREPEDQQLQKPLAAWNEVEYSRVLVVKNNHGPDETWSSPSRMWSLPNCWDLANTCPESPFSQQSWAQNLTYETFLDVRSYNRETIESTDEFPLLVSLVAMEGDLHSAERSHT
ncbi:granulocyte colony-stimulating factor receptor-like [Candoia aspera]|uniref:granulocyte colony-stimulating factor receptor-like n=1 Tax=Candoia aspera TaxID=51853 RepID=UPI002FD8539B